MRSFVLPFPGVLTGGISARFLSGCALFLRMTRTLYRFDVLGIDTKGRINELERDSTIEACLKEEGFRDMSWLCIYEEPALRKAGLHVLFSVLARHTGFMGTGPEHSYPERAAERVTKQLMQLPGYRYNGFKLLYVGCYERIE